MPRIRSAVAVVAVVSLAFLPIASPSNAQQKEGLLLSHDVYFTLKDKSPAAKQKLGAANSLGQGGQLKRR